MTKVFILVLISVSLPVFANEKSYQCLDGLLEYYSDFHSRDKAEQKCYGEICPERSGDHDMKSRSIILPFKLYGKSGFMYYNNKQSVFVEIDSQKSKGKNNYSHFVINQKHYCVAHESLSKEPSSFDKAELKLKFVDIKLCGKISYSKTTDVQNVETENLINSAITRTAEDSLDFNLKYRFSKKRLEDKWARNNCTLYCHATSKTIFHHFKAKLDLCQENLESTSDIKLTIEKIRNTVIGKGKEIGLIEKEASEPQPKTMSK